jgi:hypothetical protein
LCEHKQEHSGRNTDANWCEHKQEHSGRNTDVRMEEIIRYTIFDISQGKTTT